MSSSIAGTMIRNARRRARSSGVPFAIIEEDIPPIPAFCPVLEIPLSQNLGKGVPHDYSPSLDRIQPALGYVPGNVRVISYRANCIRNNASGDELLKIAMDSYHLEHLRKVANQAAIVR